MRKVVYVGGTCDFCEGFRKWFNHKELEVSETPLVEGRVYTVSHEFHVECWWEPYRGSGYQLVEAPPSHPDYGFCSCQFRDVEGDAEEWERIVQRHKPKTKELEPA